MTTTATEREGRHTPIEALAEVIKLWLPGLKADPMVVAGTMQRNLLKRGVGLVPVAEITSEVAAITKSICPHYDDGRSDPENGMFSKKAGECLFSSRNWSASCTPKRCSDCPALNSGAHDDLVAALRAVQKIISEAAMTGFNWQDGDWPQRLFESQQATSAALRLAKAGAS